MFLDKKFRELENRNPKLDMLADQTKKMNFSLKDMVRNRDDARKRLEAK